MSTPKGRKSPKHERVTRATTAAAAAASKALAQMATAAASKAPAPAATAAASKAPAPAVMAPKALEKIASMAPEQTAFKAKDKDFNNNFRIDRLETDIKILQRLNNILLGEINELKKFIIMLSK